MASWKDPHASSTTLRSRRTYWRVYKAELIVYILGSEHYTVGSDGKGVDFHQLPSVTSVQGTRSEVVVNPSDVT